MMKVSANANVKKVTDLYKYILILIPKINFKLYNINIILNHGSRGH